MRSARLSAAVVRRSAAVVAWNARSSVTDAIRFRPSFVAKEALASLLPRLLCTRINLGAFDRIEERTGESFEIESIATGCGDQLTELVDTFELERALLVL